ncbi:hypothetical protein WQ54_21475 [Bacillus sp. SA1-12]|uniref:hypothetical protein n=1 Tax=Bacillus sp. SA1-12 TaxID=1455638 RepID=UPI000627460B|nr:hypothetical protein [Bacillus sp. SA1-12]KKI90516.1 hypothetical protein WQ54_21475 [Bacillus sp. SA1-12]
MKISGGIISGEFDKDKNEFALQEIKSFSTETTLKEQQLNALYEYLSKHQQEEGGQVLTLYDQMPVLFTRQEIKELLKDLHSIKALYH